MIGRPAPASWYDKMKSSAESSAFDQNTRCRFGWCGHAGRAAVVRSSLAPPPLAARGNPRGRLEDVACVYVYGAGRMMVLYPSWWGGRRLPAIYMLLLAFLGSSQASTFRPSTQTISRFCDLQCVAAVGLDDDETESKSSTVVHTKYMKYDTGYWLRWLQAEAVRWWWCDSRTDRTIPLGRDVPSVRAGSRIIRS